MSPEECNISPINLQLGNGNGICNDDANSKACGYDGGDCCDSKSSFAHCTFCECLEDENTCPLYVFVGDGICDEANLTNECFQDGGDCEIPF